jgi:hypothetical protein
MHPNGPLLLCFAAKPPLSTGLNPLFCIPLFIQDFYGTVIHPVRCHRYNRDNFPFGQANCLLFGELRLILLHNLLNLIGLNMPL